jgi:hypothetical protein
LVLTFRVRYSRIITIKHQVVDSQFDFSHVTTPTFS